MTDDGLNIDFGEMYAFDMVDGDKTVGQMNVSVHKQKNVFSRRKSNLSGFMVYRRYRAIKACFGN